MTSKGDFIGFTLDGVHSVDLNVMRVSDGTRYTDNLIPMVQDKTIQVPGGDGNYMFGTSFVQRPFQFPIAYDCMTEQNIRDLRRLMGQRKIMGLIFDELPYKVYKVRPTGTPNLKYVCFETEAEYDSRVNDVDDSLRTKDDLYGVGTRIMKGRLYRGEGTLSFTAYTPFARSRFKYLDEYTVVNIPEWGSMDSPAASDVFFNYYEWVESSRMKLSSAMKKRNNVDYVIDTPTNAGCMVYNAGDIETPFTLKIWFNGAFGGLLISYAADNKSFRIEPFNKQTALGSNTQDAGIQINTALNLIEGIDSAGNPTGTIYNRYTQSGDFFKIAPTNDLEWMGFSWAGASPTKMKIEYDYLYF